jgi:hypothetical protein
MNWEDCGPYHKRCKVPGGWLVKAYEAAAHWTDNGYHVGWDWRIAMCFVPDPLHAWEIDKEDA